MNRLIEAEAAKEALRNRASESISECIDAIPTAAPQWIPVSEGLPQAQKNGDKDYSEWVQITLHIGEDNDVVGRAFYCFSEKKWYTNELGVGEVTAWMPLPKPFEPQESEEQE